MHIMGLTVYPVRIKAWSYLGDCLGLYCYLLLLLVWVNANFFLGNLEYVSEICIHIEIHDLKSFYWNLRCKW